MGFKSIMKKVGKVALKVAPYAAMAIPGVGPLAAMGISAATSAADKKLSGGSWKSALGAGAIGAGTSLIGSKLPVKGIGPSASVAKEGVKQSTKSVLGNMAKSSVSGLLGGGGGSASSWKDLGKMGINAAINYGGGMGQQSRTPDFNPGPSGDFNGGNSRIPGGIIRGVGPRNAPMSQMDQSNPNLAEFIGQGRREAIRNQPFRSGYDVITSPEEPAEGSTPMVPAKTVRMPPIYPNRGGGRNRRQAMMQ